MLFNLFKTKIKKEKIPITPCGLKHSIIPRSYLEKFPVNDALKQCTTHIYID